MTFRLSSLIGLMALAAPALAQDYGDLVISEISIAPSTGAPEWFELHNPTSAAIDLQGCALYEGKGTGGAPYDWVERDHTVSDPTSVSAGGYALLTKTSDACLAFDSDALTNCIALPDYAYGSLGFNNSGAPEHLAIECGGTLIDEITYDWTVFDDDCTTADGKNCSVNLRSELLDADANDDWSSDSWCVPLEAELAWDINGSEFIGTPGQANLCPTLLDPCVEADAMFTELMPAPPDGYKEWIELYGLAGSECNLSGCEIRQGVSADPFDTAEEWDVVLLEGTGGNLPMVNGDFLLLAKSDECVAGTGTGDDFVCDIPADLTYSSISLPNSDDKWLHLVCGDTLVDSAPVQWGDFEAFCPDKGCAVGLNPDSWNVNDNDLIDHWCVAGSDQALTNPSGETIYGSPGAENECLTRVWPAPGEIIFTELIASPQGGVSEYMELHNNASNARDLTFCELRKWRLDEAGEVDPDSVKTYLFGEDSTELSMEGGADQLLAYSSCLWEEDETGACAGGEYLYSRIQITADQAEHLAILCDGEIVDQVVFHSDAEGVRAGHSWMLDPGSYDAEANDNSANWCESAFSQQLDELSFPEDDKCNYGTPGEPNECTVSQPDPPDPVLRCATGPSGFAWLGLLGLAGLLIRRRRQ